MSPIRGMSDRRATFPQIGVIRKGAAKTEKNRPGADLEYFRVVFDEGELIANQRFHELYGDEPTEINVMLPFDDIDQVWEAWRESYNASALIHRCDGEYVEYAINSATGEVLVRNGIMMSAVPGRPDLHLGDRVPCNGKAECKPTGRLTVVVPELRRAATLMVLTTSIHDIVNISGQLEALKSLNSGRLAGLPLVLRRRPKRISTPSGEGGKRARREKWLLSIEADPEWVEAKIAQLKGEAYSQFTAPSPYALVEDILAREKHQQDRDSALPAVRRKKKGLFKVEEPETRSVRQDMEDVFGRRAAESLPEPEIESGFDEFVTDVLRELDYYSHQKHVENTMRKLNLEWTPAASEVIWEVLEEYADTKGDEQVVIGSDGLATSRALLL